MTLRLPTTSMTLTLALVLGPSAVPAAAAGTGPAPVSVSETTLGNVFAGTQTATFIIRSTASLIP